MFNIRPTGQLQQTKRHANVSLYPGFKSFKQEFSKEAKEEQDRKLVPSHESPTQIISPGSFPFLCLTLTYGV